MEMNEELKSPLSISETHGSRGQSYRLPSFAILFASLWVAVFLGVDFPSFTFTLFAVPYRYGLFVPICGLLAAAFVSEDRLESRKSAMLSTLVLSCSGLLLLDIADQRVSVFLQQVNGAFRLYAYVLAGLLSAWGLWLNSRLWYKVEAHSTNVFLQALALGYSVGLAAYALSTRSAFVLGLIIVSVIAVLRGDAIWNKGIRGVASIEAFTPKKKEFLVFVCAFLVRVAWAFNVVRTTGENFILASDDGQVYLKFGRLLVRGAQEFWPYGGLAYSYFLGILDFLGRSNVYFMVLVQTLISALVPWVVFRLGRQLLSERAAWIGALFAIANGNLIFLAGVLGMEAISIPLIAVGVLLLVEASNSNTMSRLKWGGYAGLALGVALLFRSDAIIAVPILALVIGFRLQRLGVSFEQGIKEFKTVVAGIILGAFVLCCLNFFVLGTFSISNRQADVSFEQELADDSLSTGRLARMGFNPFLDLSLSLKTLKDEPVLVPMVLVRTLATRVPHFFVRPSFGYFDLVYVVKPYPAHNLLFAEFVQTLGAFLTIVGLTYFVWASFSGSHEIEFRILLLFFGVTTVLYSLIVAFNSRYRGGIEFIIALAAAAAFERMFVRRNEEAGGPAI